MPRAKAISVAAGIAQPLSLLLKTSLPSGSELALYDVNPMVVGVGVDLSHIPTGVSVTGYGQDGLDECLKGADIVVIPAGVPRKPGMTRDDLFKEFELPLRDLDFGCLPWHHDAPARL